MNLTPKSRRRLVVAAAVLVVFTVFGFLIAPSIIKSQLEKRASAELGRRVTVEKVRFNPYTLAVTLEDMSVREADGTTPFLGWKRLYVNFDALRSLWGAWVLSDIELDGFNARVALNADQSFNFSDILKKLVPANAPQPPPVGAKPGRPLRVVSLKVSQAQVAFSDASRKQPFATTVGPVTFSLTEFRTVSERGAPYRFEAVTEANERFAWSGTLQAEPLSSVGELVIENIVLSKYAPYYTDLLQADLTDGLLSVRGAYEFAINDKERTMRLKNGSVSVRGLKLLERASRQPAVELPEFSVTGIDADATNLKATVASVALNGGSIHARREKDGSINLLAMLVPAQPAATPAAPAASTAPAAPQPSAPALPDVLVREVTVKGLQVDVADLAAPRPAHLGLSEIQVSLRNVTLAQGAQIPVQASFTWAPKGTVQLEGTLALSPVKADVKVNVTELELLPLSPYLEQFVNARMTQGTVTTTLEAHASVTADAPPAATLTGEVRLDKLGLVDGAHNEELAGLGSLNLRGIRISTTPELTVALEEINVTAPFARVIMNTDKTLNLASVLRSEPAAPEQTAAQPATPQAGPSGSPAAALPKIEIGRIVIAEGDYRFTDRSVEPNVRMAITQFGGTITGLSATNPAKADVDLKAMVDGVGPISVTGKLDPLGAKPSVSLKIDFKNVDLLPLSPYSGKYAGYELARGKLFLDIKLAVDGKAIDSANVVTLNQFTFGNAVQSPDATKLPVRLGVALLKDIDGKIVIDMPVQGSLDDPNFRVGRVVLRVITNLLTKAAVSPFTLLGAAFGGGGEELAFQEFQPGTTELQQTEAAKLDTLVKALTNRPGLNLSLEGSYDAAADGYAMKRQKLDDQVRRAIWEKKHQIDPNIAPPAELAITPEEKAAMVKTLFDAKFPPGTQFGTPLPSKPAVVAAPPPPKAGMFQRAIRVVTLKSLRERRAAKAEDARLAAEHAKAVESATAAGLPLDEMAGRLAEAIAIDDNDLRALAEQRAQRVREYFTTTGHIAPDRLFLASAQPGTASTAAATGKGPRVFLSLQ